MPVKLSAPKESAEAPTTLVDPIKNKESHKRSREAEPTPSQAVADDVMSDVDSLDLEEAELAELVFGGDSLGAVSQALNASLLKSTFVGTKDKVTASKDDHEETETTLGFSIDNTGSIQPKEKLHAPSTAEKQPSEIGMPAAWVDEDDDIKVDVHKVKRLRKLRNDFDETTVAGSDYEMRLRHQYERLFPKPKWAQVPTEKSLSKSESDLDHDDDKGDRDTSDQVDLGHNALLKLLQSTESIVNTNGKALLSADKLDVMRLKDVNQLAYSQAVVQSVQFHPYAPVLLTAGFDKTLRLFQVDGKLNSKIQSIYIKDMPIHKAHFTADGRRIIMTGRRKWFYVYDLESGTTEKIWGVRGRKDKSFERSIISPCGKYIGFLCLDGNVTLVSSNTMQWMSDVKMNGHVRCAVFSADGTRLFTFGGSGEVYEWDVETRECLNRFTDQGCLRPTAIAVSNDGKYIATGSSSGVVNVYLMESIRSASVDDGATTYEPQPVKVFMNLTTSITTLIFHPDSKLLLMASHSDKNALRIAHLPSMRVVKNWPTKAIPFDAVSTAAFSPHGGYLSVGNAKGKALLFKLGAYDA
ncbi:hypothetical protein BDV3_002900 [Batrachochytrium dendrobatidis]|uniref:U3 small nucleolar RNA-associated protein 18 homolog n=1 Tax=Batrachochytrium dendrobatidis (strain JEL423) TaxID=403673 RepID=A0A177WY52_BATDL|nr:hypothetical protein BDEG_28205 [Batrachochytrium dendrobatidis JEL423]